MSLRSVLRARLASPLTAACLAALPALAAAQQPQGRPGAALSDAARRAAQGRIEPGDRLVLKVFQEPTLSDSLVVVNDRGEANFAKLGLVQVSRWTVGEASDSLRARFARYLRNPALDLLVLRRVTVNGAVREPGVIYVDVSATVRDAIAQSGGITTEGNPGKVSVLRDGQMRHVKRWRDAQTEEGDLRSGDQIYVGEKNWLTRNALGVASTAAVVASVAFTIINSRR
jgi:polysaccharide export outer membrane protein